MTTDMQEQRGSVTALPAVAVERGSTGSMAHSGDEFYTNGEGEEGAVDVPLIAVDGVEAVGAPAGAVASSKPGKWESPRSAKERIRRRTKSRIDALKADRDQEYWHGEAWHRDDGLLLNLPLFERCGLEFKRGILRHVRCWEMEFNGQETWYDQELDHICTLETLPVEVIPPLRRDIIGQAVDQGEFVCRGGDYDTKLILVLSGTLEKLVGDSPYGGRCVVRHLRRGDCEGLTEFLGAGSEQRTCCLRGGPGGARVRFVTRERFQKLLREEAPGLEEGRAALKFPDEAAYFAKLVLDRIDSLSHKAAEELLEWPSGVEGQAPLRLMSLPGQTLFSVDSGLGTSVSGPLPEGIEERYFLDGQTVIRPGIRGDCCVMILRGEVEAEVPQGCQGQCLPRLWDAEAGKPTYAGRRTAVVRDPTEESWLGTGRPPERARQEELAQRAEEEQALQAEEQEKQNMLEYRLTSGSMSPKQLRAHKIANEVAVVSLVPPDKLRLARKKIQAAADAGSIDLSDQLTSDWRWAVTDERALDVIDLLREARLLSPAGERRADEVVEQLRPPPPPPPNEPQAVLGPGSVIGQLCLLGTPVVLGGAVRARGPVLVAVLHRRVLMEALAGVPELAFFERRGVTMKERIRVLAKQKQQQTGDVAERSPHLGPVTGPPPRDVAGKAKGPEQATGGSFAAFATEGQHYHGIPGADALDHVLLHSLRGCAFIWDLISDAPHRLLEHLVREFEPRWLLPGEVVVADEEPDADFIFVVVHGTFVVTLEDEVIDHCGQGTVQGFAQILGLNDWTRTVTVAPDCRGEAMVQVLRRSCLERILQGHPGPKGHLQEIRDDLVDASEADWRLLQRIPAFCTAASKAFLSRVHKDADVQLYCPGDFLAEEGEASASMMVVTAGVCRSEHPQTLFFVELKRGDWCFQNNILGIESTRAHDVVAVTHVMVLVLHRHALLNAVVAHPDAGEVVLLNETWRARESMPRLASLRLFEGVPGPGIARLESEAAPRFYKKGSVILPAGGALEDDNLLFLVRGEVSVSILGIEIRVCRAGDVLGLHRFLGLPAGTSQAEVVALTACDALSVRRSTLQAVLEDENFEIPLAKLKNAMSVLNGGAILDAFGFPVGKKPALFVPDCIETSDVFRVCGQAFVAQIPRLVEERAFWPGEKLYSQGDAGDFMFFVQAGRVELQQLGRKEHEEPDTGCTLGDMAVLDQVPCHAETAVATTHVWARALHKRLLKRALSSFPEEERRLTGARTGAGGGLFEDT